MTLTEIIEQRRKAKEEAELQKTKFDIVVDKESGVIVVSNNAVSQ